MSRTKDLAVIAAMMNSVRSVINAGRLAEAAQAVITGIDVDNTPNAGAEFIIYGTSEIDDNDSRVALHHDPESGAMISGWIYVRTAQAKDTSRLHGPALLERVALDLVRSGANLRRISWQVMTGDDGKISEKVWADVSGMFHEAIKERLKDTGWEWESDVIGRRWNVAGAAVEVRFVFAD